MRTTGSTASGIWAVRAFLQKVPDWMPSPEVLVEEDGMICFDWDERRNCTMSVSLDDNGHAHWSALIGDYRTHGAGSLDRWPEPLSEAFQRFGLAMQHDAVDPVATSQRPTSTREERSSNSRASTGSDGRQE